MAIGHHVQKYQAAKAAAQKEEPMATEDPKTETPVEPSMAGVLAMMAELLKEMRATPADGANAAVLEMMLATQEALLNKTRPENAQSPGIGAYSYPEGELARPKPALKCKVLWCGYELTTDTMRPDEIDWVNRLEPGEFRVTKADGTKIPFTVTAKHSQAFDEKTQRFKLEELNVWFPCKGEHKQNHMSLVSYCQQAVNGSIPGTDELLREVARLKAEVAAAKAGVLSAV